ncbi:MAG: TorF family putative porin [Methylobacter sp.]
MISQQLSVDSSLPYPSEFLSSHLFVNLKQSGALRMPCHDSFRLIFLRLACLSLVLWLPVSQADWHGDIKLLSDYVYRGYSKSRGNPVVQGNIDYQDDSGWYAGLAASQVRFDDQKYADRAEIEIKPYLGWSLPLSTDWKGELSVTGYIYDNKIFNHTADYAEFYASLHYKDWLSATASIAPNAYQRHANVADYELTYRRDVLDTVQFSAGLGYNQAGALLGHDYFYWNAGVSWFATSYLSLDVRYVDVALPHQDLEDHHDDFYPRQQENKYLFSATLGF